MSRNQTTNTSTTTVIDRSFCTEERLKSFLKNKQAFSPEERDRLKYCIDNYSDCWRIWNKVRWDAAMDSRGVQELKEYLGDDFVPYYDSSWELAKEWQEKDRTDRDSIESFYKTTNKFVYNSVIFYESGHRQSFKEFINSLKNTYHITSVIDFGCGSGNDGLDMLESNLKVTFLDFNSPSLDFLRWRINRRGFSPELYKINNIDNHIGEKFEADMLWSVDVIEHMIDPLDIFSFLRNLPKLIVYFTDSDDDAGGRHPFHFKIDAGSLGCEFERRGYIKLQHPYLTIWKLASMSL